MCVCFLEGWGVDYRCPCPERLLHESLQCIGRIGGTEWRHVLYSRSASWGQMWRVKSKTPQWHCWEGSATVQPVIIPSQCWEHYYSSALFYSVQRNKEKTLSSFKCYDPCNREQERHSWGTDPREAGWSVSEKHRSLLPSSVRPSAAHETQHHTAEMRMNNS